MDTGQMDKQTYDDSIYCASISRAVKNLKSLFCVHAIEADMGKNPGFSDKTSTSRGVWHVVHIFEIFACCLLGNEQIWGQFFQAHY